MESEYELIQTGFNLFIIIDLLQNIRSNKQILLDLNTPLVQIQQRITKMAQPELKLKEKFKKYFEDKQELKLVKKPKKLSHFQMLKDL